MEPKAPSVDSFSFWGEERAKFLCFLTRTALEIFYVGQSLFHAILLHVTCETKAAIIWIGLEQLLILFIKESKSLNKRNHRPFRTR